MLPLPVCAALSTLPVTRRSRVLCVRVKMHPCLSTFPTPVYVTPLQQNRYCPVNEFHSNTVLGLLSSCMQTSNTVAVKLQLDVLPDASVAVQLTVVVPTGKQVPVGGTQATVTPGQLSLAVAVKLTVWQGTLPTGGQAAGFVTAVTFAGQVIVGAWQSLTVTVKVQLGPAVVVQVTVVVPFGKNEPDAGVQVTVPQVPVVIGAG